MWNDQRLDLEESEKNKVFYFKGGCRSSPAAFKKSAWRLGSP
jgi:hypothetical protein